MSEREKFLTLALQNIIAANKDFRDGMPQNWDGDPLQDACDEAAKLLLVPAQAAENCGNPTLWVCLVYDPIAGEKRIRAWTTKRERADRFIANEGLDMQPLYAYPATSSWQPITDKMVRAGAAAMCCQAQTLGCAAKNKDSEFSTCMLSTFMEDARRCLSAALPPHEHSPEAK